ncbi:MAG: hypothetical protein CMB08_04960 [Euryarchaeota archaeon]|nr:hypothetical protein [Euryarchaeota archaeon]
MNNRKIIAIMMTTSMLAAAFAGCLGGDDDEEEWALSVASDVDSVIVSTSWDSILGSIATNSFDTCDAIISSVTITAERDEAVDFTTAYYSSTQGVIAGPGVAAISDVSELNVAGTTILVQTGTTSDLYAASDLPLATVVAFEDFDSVFTGLANGDGHYALGDAPVLALESTLLTTFSPENFGIVVADDADNELEDALNVAIAAIIASGEYDAHLEAWFPGTSGTLEDTTTAATATAYPMPTEGSALTTVLESGNLRFCSDTTYPPFENLDSAGNAVGFSMDIADALADEIAEHYANIADTTVLGCTDSQSSAYDANANLDDGSCGDRVKIGFLLDQTSPAISSYAANFMAAAQIAIDDLNDDGGYFELVAADTACDGATAGQSATVLAASGVVGVAGAACSGASIGANNVLGPLGIPMISYASTAPSLSDNNNHQNFWRVVPSDAGQGPAMTGMIIAVAMQNGAPDMATAMGLMNPALLHMSNDYGVGLGGAFNASWQAAGGSLCMSLPYDQADATTDYAALVGQVVAAGCGSVVMASYAADGAAIMEALRTVSAIPAFGGDGIASEDWSTPITGTGDDQTGNFGDVSAANLVFATKPIATTGSGTFADDCAASTDCAGGIYTAETYDAITIIGKAYNMESGANMATHIGMVGTNYAGASGTINFDANGDIPAENGYDICVHAIISSTDTYLNCQWFYTTAGGVEEYVFSGTTIKLGFLLDLTSGAVSPYAAGFVAAREIALAVMNAAGYSNGLQFEVVVQDTACSNAGGVAAATALSQAGVVGVVGAACSGASTGANSVLGPLGIPMISYASTSPQLNSDGENANFWRVVPSDALQGQALASAITAGSNPAILMMSNDYGTGLGSAVNASWHAAGGSTCFTAPISYDNTDFDGAAIAQQVYDAGCDSVVLASYAADGAQLITDLQTAGFTGAYYGGDGVSDTEFDAPEGMVTTKPGVASNPSERALAFQALCAASPECSGAGNATAIYTAEVFDAMIVMGYSIFAQAGSPTVPLTSMIQVVGQGFVGATGDISFMENGDVPGNGYEVCTFDSSSSLTCDREWTATGGLADVAQS